MPGTAYLCGPISHRPDGNRPAFMEAESWLRRMGWRTINPLTVRPLLSREALLEAQDLGDRYREGRLYRSVMRGCYADLLTVTAIMALPGWDTSAGAVDEMWFAKKIGLEMHELRRDQKDNRVIARIEPMFGLDLHDVCDVP